jgi:hypothetical protein
MLRVTATLVLTLWLLGCGSLVPPAPPGEPVELLTGVMPFDEDECSADGLVAVLLVDPRYGTTMAGAYGQRYPVMWRPGFTGRRVGSEVVVVDPGGNLVAITGQSYRMSGNALVQAPTGGWPNREDHPFRRGWVNSLIGPDMYYACNAVGPEPTNEPLHIF